MDNISSGVTIFECLFQLSIGEITWTDARLKLAEIFNADHVDLIVFSRDGALPVDLFADSRSVPSRLVPLLKFSDNGVLSKTDFQSNGDLLIKEDKTGEGRCELLCFPLNNESDFVLSLVRNTKVSGPGQDYLSLCKGIQKCLKALLIKQQAAHYLAGAFDLAKAKRLAVALLYPSGEIFEKNTLLDEVLLLDDGLSVFQNQFVFSDQEDARIYKESLHCITNSKECDGKMQLIHRKSGNQPFLLEMIALSLDEKHVFLKKPFIKVTIRNLETPIQLPRRPMMTIFGLTEAEAVVSQQLFLNKSEQLIADEMKNSLNTIKTHRKRIYSKLNISSRAELIATVSKIFI
ncbi:helix-turn-helix transcriptional regulator [Terasakiella pusilla]|uniref:helix-turn-helix transcriptional regulator n=1 Tax=Terasakiella pusilla TaxID=64973 RepID=UPI003AA854F3